MATPAQIRANRLNAQHSTGPRSAEGKAASRFNAVKHGIDARSAVIPGEDPAELESLAREYHDQFRPVGPLENYLVETLIHADWGRRRFRRLEAHFLSVLLDSGERGPAAEALPACSSQPSKTGGSGPDRFLDRIFRQLAAAERNYFRALAELRRARQERSPGDPVSDALDAAVVASEPPAPAGTSRPAAETPDRPPIGFVPHIRSRAAEPVDRSESASCFRPDSEPRLSWSGSVIGDKFSAISRQPFGKTRFS